MPLAQTRSFADPEAFPRNPSIDCRDADRPPRLRFVADAAPLCELREVRGDERARAEQFIAHRYRRAFGARIDAFMPRILVLADGTGGIAGALGIRGASERLFVEQYLDVPIERALSAVAGEDVPRSAIVEVGHLSGLLPGVVRASILLLSERLLREGAEWVAFTGTRALRNAFVRMGLVPTPIAAASPSRLPLDARVAWGSYYACEPEVYVGRIAIGFEEAARRRAAVEAAA